MTNSKIVSNEGLHFKSERELLALILIELRAMRQQEKDYWETWKVAKQAKHSKEEN
jgi:hypothetical protein